MNGTVPVRRLALATLLLGLVTVAACGQMGPLQLPADPAPVTGSDEDDDGEDDGQ